MHEPSAPRLVPPIDIPDSVLSGIHGSSWVASWWLAGPGSALCALGAARLLVLRGPAARSRHKLVSLAGVLSLAACAGALLANAYSGYVPDPGAARRLLAELTGLGTIDREPGVVGDQQHGSVSVVRVPGNEALRVPGSKAWVYTPGGYDGSGATRYPVLYLIHGYPGMAADWFVAGGTERIMDALLAGHLIDPMLVVSLDVNAGWQKDTGCLDAVDGPKMETWLYDTVLPFFERSYPLRPGRAARALGGVSAGGYCALDQGLRHQETWSTILSFEGYGDPGRGGRIAFKGDRRAIRSHSPALYLPTMTFTHPQAFYLDSGDRIGMKRVAKLAALLSSRAQVLYHRVNRGHGHSWSEVRAGLPHALVFASRQLEMDNG